MSGKPGLATQFLYEAYYRQISKRVSIDQQIALTEEAIRRLMRSAPQPGQDND